MENNKDVMRIAASLRYGKFEGGNRTVNLVLLIGCSIMCVAVLVGVTIFMCTDYEKSISLSTLILGLICFFIIALMFYALMLYSIVSNEMQRKKLSLWLKDAVELDAYSKKIGEIKGSWLPPTAHVYKLRVFFSFDGKKMSRDSTEKRAGSPKGYSITLMKYADKQIKIMYSPKYDEVMILKDKDEK